MAADFLTYSLSGVAPQPTGNEAHYTSPRNSYRTRDDKWVALSASSQAPFERLMDLVGRPDLRTAAGFRNNQERLHPESRRVLNRIIGDWITDRTLAEVLEACEKAGVTIGPVYSMEEVARDPQYIARGSFLPVFDPATETTIPFPNIPIRFSTTPGAVRFPGLPMGAANEVVLQDLLGYTPAEIAALRASGAI
jgi:crotonobetainyl-CoA:carnitine CoA-transferase CaiB-like acyl-CoA transferase